MSHCVHTARISIQLAFFINLIQGSQTADSAFVAKAAGSDGRELKTTFSQWSRAQLNRLHAQQGFQLTSQLEKLLASNYQVIPR